MKFVDVFQFFNYLLEEMSRCNCFPLQLLGGGDSRRTLDREAGVCSKVKTSAKGVSLDDLLSFNEQRDRGH